MDITLLTIDNHNYELTEFAITKTLENVDCKKVIVMSDQNFLPQYDFVSISKDFDIFQYNQIILKGLNQYIDTEYLMIVQWDGFPVNKNLWTDQFLEYDYIGAPWWDNVVGNGGFSLRTKKLLKALEDPEIQITDKNEIGEDVAICRTHRKRLEQAYNIKFAPLKIADRFSVEHRSISTAYGFHGLWNANKFLTDNEIKYIIDRLPENFLKNSSKMNLFVNSLNTDQKKYLFSKVG